MNAVCIENSLNRATSTLFVCFLPILRFIVMPLLLN